MALVLIGFGVVALASEQLLELAGDNVATERLVTGLLVTGTPAEPVVYVTSSDPRIGGGPSGLDTGSDTNSGIVSRLTRTGSGWTHLDLVRGLPRSRENHATNGLALDPRTGMLYVAQGGNTNMGAPGTGLAYLPEYALSGAILAIDLRRIGATTYDLPTLGGGDEPFGGENGRNQARLVPGGPVEIFAPGYRNPYDVLLTARGLLYTVQNGAARDWGAPPRDCTNARREPGVREIDTLHRLRRGAYGGHPNPTRANRSNTFDGRSPVAVANPVECEHRVPSERGALAFFQTSTNGLAEYTASNLGGALRGDLLAASFDGWVHRLALDDTGEHVVRHEKLFPLLMPLDVVAQPDDGLFPGTVWVARYAPGIYWGPPVPDSIVVYEPQDAGERRRWERLSATGLKRQEVSLVEAGGKLYLAGGGRRHQAYDPATDRWIDVAQLPAKLDHIQGVELDGLVYYIGGLVSWPEPEAGSVYVYDPSTDTFSEGAPMPRPRGAGGVAAHGGKLYYAGGLHAGEAVAWFDEYDPKADTWRRLPDMPRPRDHFHAAVVAGRLFAIGGREKDLGETTTANDAFDFASGVWRTGLAPLPTPRGGFGTAVVGDEILVIGGERPDGALGSVESYDTGTDSWRTLEPMPTARHGVQAAVLDGAVYVAAGGVAPGAAPTDVTEALVLANGVSRRPRRPLRSSFRRSVLRGTSSTNPTSLQFGPDGRLYVTQQDGLIKVYTVVRRGPGDYAVTATEEIRTVQDIPNHDDDGSSATEPGDLLRTAWERLTG